MKKYLENDDDVEILETWKDLKEYLTFREKHDEWVQPFINELAAIGIPNHPLFFQTNCTNLSVQKNGYRLDVKDIDYEDPENLSCIEDTGLFLVFPYKDSMAVYPTRRIILKKSRILSKRKSCTCQNKNYILLKEKCKRTL